MIIRVKLCIRQTEINCLIGSELELTLETGSCIVDVVKAVDEEISKRTATFPVKGVQEPAAHDISSGWGTVLQRGGHPSL